MPPASLGLQLTELQLLHLGLWHYIFCLSINCYFTAWTFPRCYDNSINAVTRTRETRHKSAWKYKNILNNIDHGNAVSVLVWWHCLHFYSNIVPCKRKKKEVLKFCTPSLKNVCDPTNADEEWRSHSRLSPDLFGCTNAEEISRLSINIEPL